MCQSVRCYFVVIVILLAGGLSCNRAAPISKQPQPATLQPQLAEQAGGLDASTPDSGTQGTTANTDNHVAPSNAAEPETVTKQPSDAEPTAESTQPADAEDVLKDALARAADEKKLLLAHVGAPG